MQPRIPTTRYNTAPEFATRSPRPRAAREARTRACSAACSGGSGVPNRSSSWRRHSLVPAHAGSRALASGAVLAAERGRARVRCGPEQGSDAGAARVLAAPRRAAGVERERRRRRHLRRQSRHARHALAAALARVARQRAMLVVEDPVSIEAEALPNGILFASRAHGTHLPDGQCVERRALAGLAPGGHRPRGGAGRRRVAGGGARAMDGARGDAARAGRRRTGARGRLASRACLSGERHGRRRSVGRNAAWPTLREAAPTTPIEFVALGGWRVRWSCDGATCSSARRRHRAGRCARASARGA